MIIAQIPSLYVPEALCPIRGHDRKWPMAAGRLWRAGTGSEQGYNGNIATTSGYLHARPDSSSGLRLDPGVFLR